MDWLIILAITADSLFAAVACGASGISIRPLSCAVIAGVSSSFFLLSALGGGSLSLYFSAEVVRWIGCLALTGVGLAQIAGAFCTDVLCRLSQFCPHCIRKAAEISRDSTRADADQNRVLSAQEALVLALPLSADSLLSGWSITCGSRALCLRWVSAFLCGYFAVYCGNRLSSRVSLGHSRTRAVLCGLLLIALGISKKFL